MTYDNIENKNDDWAITNFIDMLSGYMKMILL